MTDVAKLGFTRGSNSLIRNIYIPRYYDPQIDSLIAELASTHDMVSIGDLIDAGHLTVHYGHDIGKHHYGLGRVPYVRTSDLATWEVVAAPKQMVSQETFESYNAKQDVRVGDVLFIRDGLYLIGRAAIVTEWDLPLIHQSHLLRFRPTPDSPITGPMLLALLSTPTVIRQVRSKQFTAGIIDKIEDRYRELRLPVPRNNDTKDFIADRADAIVQRRAWLRNKLKSIPLKAQGLSDDIELHEGEAAAVLIAAERARLGFASSSAEIQSNVFIPKYYNPGIQETLGEMSTDYYLRSIGDLVSDGLLSLSTGVEVGKLAYGMGEIPFVRTSDLANWELAGEPKQRISRAMYESLRDRVDLRADDILLVRDGTYLVGTSAILTQVDAEALYAGGLYRIRALKPSDLDPYLLLAILNSPIVKLQMRAKQFTRDIIDTLGRRLLEVVLPIPRSTRFAAELAQQTREIVEERVALREEAKALVLSIEGNLVQGDEEDEEIAAHFGL
jgi:hypothetical protein